MIERDKIFNIKNLIRVVAMVAVCAISTGAHAYSGGYDDDDYNDCPYFSPAYALCTVHAYNAGLPKNPTDAAQIADMNDVIALKATLIAQQIKQQYDALNAMVKRFKTQLEKSVYKSKIEVLTGGSSSSSSSSSSASKDGLANAEDCYAVTDQSEVYDCLSRNLNKISQAVEKDMTSARKQLKTDMEIMGTYNIDYKKEQCPDTFGSRNEIKKCVQHLQARVKMEKRNFENENAKYRNSRY